MSGVPDELFGRHPRQRVEQFTAGQSVGAQRGANIVVAADASRRRHRSDDDRQRLRPRAS